jgi:polygalacturonase
LLKAPDPYFDGHLQMNRIKPKSAAKRYSIEEFGAIGNAARLNTSAIQKAIDRVAAAGGGTLVVPKGVFRTGAVFLKSGVNLHFSRGAVLQGSTNIRDYPRRSTRIEGHTEPWCPAIINADGIDHLCITGPGMIRGGGRPFWDAFWNRYNADHGTKNLDVYRPRNILLENCNDVLVQGIRSRDSGFWNLHLFRCRCVRIEGVDIRAPYPSPSTDGVDVDSCQHVEILNCHISVNDDCVAIKGNKGPFAAAMTEIPPVEHVRVRGCTFGFGHGVLTLGSEACVVRDVVVENCTVRHSACAKETNVVARLKLRPDTPQHYENIHWRNIRVEGRCELVAIKAWTQYFDLKGQPAPKQVVKNISISNVKGRLAHFGTISGPKAATVSEVRLENIDVRYMASRNGRGKPTPPVVLRADKLRLKNVKVNGRKLVPSREAAAVAAFTFPGDERYAKAL